MVPNVGHRNGDVLGEGTVSTHTQADAVGAEVTAARAAMAAAAADDVALGAHQVADLEVGDVGADGRNLAHELVTDDQRRDDIPSGPGVPALDVEVRPADAGLVHTDEHVVDPDLGLRHVAQLQARIGGCLHERKHGLSPVQSDVIAPPRSCCQAGQAFGAPPR